MEPYSERTGSRMLGPFGLTYSSFICLFFFLTFYVLFFFCVDLLFLHGWNHDHRQFWAFHKGSSSLNWWHFKAGSFFLWDICFVECSLFSSLSGLWPLVSPLLSCNNQKPNIIKCPLGGKSVPTWESLPCRLKVREEGAVIHPTCIWKDPTELLCSCVDHIPILNHTFWQGGRKRTTVWLWVMS